MQWEHQLHQGWEFALPPFSLSASKWLDVHSSMFFFLLGLGGVQMSLCVFPHSFSTYCLKQSLSGPEAHWFSQAVCPASSKDPLDSLPSWCWDYRRIPQQSGFYRGSEGSNPGHHMWCNSFIYRATTASTARSNLSYCYIWGVGFFYWFCFKLGIVHFIEV